MLRYGNRLKLNARQLRKNMTQSERILWERLRRKRTLGVQFYRQKPIGNYIVDFFAPKAKLVVEVDGSQHMKVSEALKDKHRDEYLTNHGLMMLRFSDLEVLKETEGVMEVIFQRMAEQLSKNPPRPPLKRGADMGTHN
jgi:very-short-patch-repair endonuclease